MAAPAIAPFQDPDWAAIFNLPIAGSQEPLVALQPESRLRLTPVYHLDGIPGALAELYLREQALAALHRALSYLPDDLGFCVLDGWRPIAVQESLRRHIGAQLQARQPELIGADFERALDRYVARPNAQPHAPSPHLTGGSVDLTLFRIRDGSMLDMGAPFDHPGEQSWTAFYETAGVDPAAKTARDHRRLLHHAMRRAGYTNLPTEWWHYDFGNQLWAHFRGLAQASYGVATLP